MNHIEGCIFIKHALCTGACVLQHIPGQKARTKQYEGRYGGDKEGRQME